MLVAIVGLVFGGDALRIGGTMELMKTIDTDDAARSIISI
jgi:hypothetical protein